ncbi:RNA polymerase subunit sigma-70 [Sphingomonas sp. Leaf33]|uniref:RNA polymerase sigma factor FliA n=1 Tax=Sphingomonas sp. Leaf33 TaxID=1736215 RepID=UPI0006FCC8E6|nr:RNA polymerase sigma factor FliA [Sphingomonas sp. Leaf33]KQN24992.1 RNA polymerase subunit sigma-70 [Sphingomonas sp. Leaf33]
MSFMSPIQPAPGAPLTYGARSRPGPDMTALVRQHMPRVRRIAWHIHGSMSSSVEVEDLVQIGLIALVEAAGSFEDRGAVTFEQYLNTRVRGSMIDELRRQATLTRGAMKRRKLYNETVAALTGADGRRPDDAKIAETLGVTIEKLRTDYATAEPVRFETIEDLQGDEGPWFVSEEPSPFDALADADQRDVLVQAIADLPEREQMVIQLYYIEELNLEEIGQVLDVGAARVCQIKKSAHDRLKKALTRRL